MSYEKVIGFGIDKNKPKAGPIDGRPHDSELLIFKKMGVEPIFLCLKKNMPDDIREPEQKIFFRSPKDFNTARTIISEAKNAFLIPGQNYEEKNPLTSILIDTHPFAMLDNSNYTLRYRFEMEHDTGAITQGDYNEKSGMKGGKIIGGCVDRFEREREQRPSESLEQAFDAFKQKYRAPGNTSPTFCDGVSYQDLRVAGGYQCARNEVGVAFKHPRDDVMFVFEICEDFWHDNQPDMERPGTKYYEWEFEVKQVWGDLPRNVRTKEDFKEYVYSAMTMFRDHMHLNIPHSTINMKSKAEISKENLESEHGLTPSFLSIMNLKNIFSYAIQLGGNKPLEQTMHEAQDSMYRMGKKLYDEKQKFNATAVKPTMDAIGHGTTTIPFGNDNIGQKNQYRGPSVALPA